MDCGFYNGRVCGDRAANADIPGLCAFLETTTGLSTPVAAATSAQDDNLFVVGLGFWMGGVGALRQNS
jgi:hypothetical protein